MIALRTFRPRFPIPHPRPGPSAVSTAHSFVVGSEGVESITATPVGVSVTFGPDLARRLRSVTLLFTDQGWGEAAVAPAPALVPAEPETTARQLSRPAPALVPAEPETTARQLSRSKKRR